MKDNKPERLRLFWAIKIENLPAFKRITQSVQNQISSIHIKTVVPENLHLTLKFLANTPVEQLPELFEIGHKTADQTKRFNIKIAELGTFGKKRQHSVLFWQTSPSDNLKYLAQILEKNHTENGFPAEKKPFKAHITIARMKQIHDYDSFRKIVNTKYAFSYTVSDIHLIQSRLLADGPKYQTIMSFSLLK